MTQVSSITFVIISFTVHAKKNLVYSINARNIILVDPSQKTIYWNNLIKQFTEHKNYCDFIVELESLDKQLKEYLQ